jgi:hypothetical protein
MATTNNFTFGVDAHPFTLNFPFIDEDNLVVTLDGVVKTLTTDYTVINKTSNTAAGVGFLSGAQIQFTASPLPTTGAVKVVRNTTLETTSTFKTGSAIRAIDLNSNFTQNLYVTEEISNNAVLINGSNAFEGNLNMDGNRIINLGSPASNTDAVNRNYVDARFSDGAGTIPSFTRWIKPATSGQTVFTGTDSNSQTLSFQQGRESVFVNGALQTRDIDYTTNTAGTSITFTVGLTLNDVVDVTCVNSLLSGVSDLASDVQYTPAGTGAVQRTVESRLRDVVSVKDFGAAGDGGTDDTSEIQASLTAGTSYVPAGTYKTTIPTQSNILGKGYGPGKIETADGNKSASYFSKADSPPTSLGNHDSIETAFNGDYSQSQFSVQHRITGATTLSQPATGYVYTPEVYPHYTYLYNNSGWNESLVGNVGRTSACAYRVKLAQYGQGDAVCYNGSAFVTNTKAGSTNFLANPGAVLFNGDMIAGADGVYLNPYETICRDNGFDVACVGLVNNFKRTVNTGAKSTVWLGYRAQSHDSTVPCDAIVSGTGQWVTGLDFSMNALNFGASKAAISLKANDRIYLNNNANALGNLDANWRTTGFNGDYIEYASGINALNFVRGGSSKLQIGTTLVNVTNSNLQVNPTGVNPSLITSKQMGFGLPTGTINTASFNPATVTLVQLAEYVAGLVTRIHGATPGAHALIDN